MTIYDLECCTDCVYAVANGEETTEGHFARMDAYQGEEPGHLAYGGESLGFSWSTCDGCGSRLGGERYQMHWVDPS